MFDDGLRIDYMIQCASRRERIFFGYHLADLAIRKFTFRFHQFVEVECDCCTFNVDLMHKVLYQNVVLGCYPDASGLPIFLRKARNGVVDKISHTSERCIKMRKARVRLLKKDDSTDDEDVMSASTATAIEPSLQSQLDSILNDFSFLEAPEVPEENHLETSEMGCTIS